MLQAITIFIRLITHQRQTTATCYVQQRARTPECVLRQMAETKPYYMRYTWHRMHLLWRKAFCIALQDANCHTTYTTSLSSCSSCVTRAYACFEVRTPKVKVELESNFIESKSNRSCNHRINKWQHIYVELDYSETVFRFSWIHIVVTSLWVGAMSVHGDQVRR